MAGVPLLEGELTPVLFDFQPDAGTLRGIGFKGSWGADLWIQNATSSSEL